MELGKLCSAHTPRLLAGAVTPQPEHRGNRCNESEKITERVTKSHIERQRKAVMAFSTHFGHRIRG
jgi:hypothetical protein